MVFMQLATLQNRPKTLFVHIVVIASVLYLCYCSTQKYKCTACFFFLLVCPWPDPYFSQKRWMMPRHTLKTHSMDESGLYCSLKCPISSPKQAYQCWAVVFNFEKPPIPVLQIFQNQRITDSVLWKKKSRIKELLVPVISKNLKEPNDFH